MVYKTLVKCHDIASCLYRRFWQSYFLVTNSHLVIRVIGFYSDAKLRWDRGRRWGYVDSSNGDVFDDVVWFLRVDRFWFEVGSKFVPQVPLGCCDVSSDWPELEWWSKLNVWRNITIGCLFDHFWRCYRETGGEWRGCRCRYLNLKWRKC